MLAKEGAGAMLGARGGARQKEQLRRWLRGGGDATGRLGQRDQALEAQAMESRRSWLHRWGHRRGLERKRDWPAAWLEREALAPLWRQR